MKLVSDEQQRYLRMQEYAASKAQLLRSQIGPLVTEKRTVQEQLTKLTERVMFIQKKLDELNESLEELKPLL